MPRNRDARSRALPDWEKVGRLSCGVSVLTKIITGNKQVCAQLFHIITLCALKTTNLLSKFPFFSGFVSHTSSRALKSLYGLVLEETAANYVKWKLQCGSLSGRSALSFGWKFKLAAERRRKKTPFTHAYLAVPSWPLFMLSLLAPILPLPPGEHRVGGLEGSYLHSPSVPSSSNFCCPVL